MPGHTPRPGCHPSSYLAPRASSINMHPMTPRSSDPRDGVTVAPDRRSSLQFVALPLDDHRYSVEFGHTLESCRDGGVGIDADLNDQTARALLYPDPGHSWQCHDL